MRQELIQSLFVACDVKQRRVIEGSVICRLLRRLLGDDADEVLADLSRYAYEKSVPY